MQHLEAVGLDLVGLRTHAVEERIGGRFREPGVVFLPHELREPLHRLESALHRQSAHLPHASRKAAGVAALACLPGRARGFALRAGRRHS